MIDDDFRDSPDRSTPSPVPHDFEFEMVSIDIPPPPMISHLQPLIRPPPCIYQFSRNSCLDVKNRFLEIGQKGVGVTHRRVKDARVQIARARREYGPPTDVARFGNVTFKVIRKIIK